MIKEARFLVVNSVPYLVSITKDKGEITDLHGPYQCIGSKGMPIESFVQEFTGLMVTALHSARPLELHDLPANIRADVESALIPKEEDADGSD
jgi:hypothetical protein